MRQPKPSFGAWPCGAVDPASRAAQPRMWLDMEPGPAAAVGWSPATLTAVPDFRGAQGAATSASASMVEPLPALSHDELETLQAALDPLLDGFGASGSCLDDALAYLERLGVVNNGVGASGETGCSALPLWIERWREAGGNRQTLRLMVVTLLALAPAGESQGSSAAGLAGDGPSSTCSTST
jgi:hypothetical protein